jgi:hypothetical protein
VGYSGPSNAQPKQGVFKEWGSFDSSANRQALKENDFSWLENFLQVGPANLQSIDGPSSILATTSGGDTIYSQADANLNGNDTIINFCTNGNGYAFNTGTGVLTKFATAAFDPSSEVFAQWQNTIALMIGPTGGYWSYNGTTLVNLSSTFTITGSVTSNVLTVTASPAGFILSPGMTLSGGTITGTPVISGYLAGNGGNGTINSANGTYSVTTANAASSAITVSPSAPASATCIATYAGRVWVAFGRTIQFSAPGSYTDFTTANGGGSFIINDSALYGSVLSMIATNNYLFYGGLDSINVISDVRIGTQAQLGGGTSTTTLYTNTNISTNVGMPFNQAIAGYLRALVFMTKRGPYILSGASPQKMGNNLDGLVPLIDFTKPIICGVVQVNLNSGRPGPAQNIVMWGFTYKDPTAGSRFLFACFFDGKWTLMSQQKTLAAAVQGFYQGTPAMYGTDGTNIYQLFINDAIVINGTIQTALWSKGDPTLDKQVMKLGIELSYSSGTASLSATADTDRSSGVVSIPLSNVTAGTWLTATGLVSTWLTVTSAISTWVGINYLPVYTDVNAFGKYYGFTITNNTSDLVVNGILSEYIERARW